MACLVIGSLSAAGCTSPTVASADGARTVYATLDGERVRLDLPLDGREPAGLALWFHGQGGDENFRMNGPWLNALRREGWAVAAGNLHGSSWGSPPAVQDAARLLAWAEKETGKKATLFVAGSMGAAVSINAMTGGLPAPKCWYGTMPVVDLDAVKAVPESSAQIREAWGGSVPSAMNPVNRLSMLPISTTYRVLASPQDKWVPKVDNADVLVRDLKRTGAVVSALSVTGPHGDPSHFQDADLARFAAGCR